MDLVMWGLTLFVWALPALFLWLASVSPVSAGFKFFAVALVILYGLVWLAFRPTRFEVDANELRILWPLRRRSIPRENVTCVRRITRSEFRAEFGFYARFGAGGLWGAFGLLWTSKAGWVNLWVSRLDGWVLVERHGARPIVLTPRAPADFVRTLQNS